MKQYSMPFYNNFYKLFSPQGVRVKNPKGTGIQTKVLFLKPTRKKIQL